MPNKYNIQLEISGPFALWTDPSGGSVMNSYPAPTYSAVEGIFKSILFLKSVRIIPYKVEIYSPLKWQPIKVNYAGPLRKKEKDESGNIKAGNSFIYMTVLTDVCYRMYAYATNKYKYPTNGAHEYQDRFNKLLKKNRSFRTPCLGLRCFTPDYWGVFRESTSSIEPITLQLPSMLKTVFDNDNNVKPVFYNNIQIKKGVINYD